MPVAVEQLWFSGGLFISVPHSFLSVHNLVNTPDEQLPHPEHDQFSAHEETLLPGLVLVEDPVWAETVEEETAIPISERTKIAIIMAACLGKQLTLNLYSLQIL
jgi:hypothetical protein